MNKAEAWKFWRNAAAIGAVGAGVVLMLDSLLQRAPPLNGRPLVRAGARMLAGAGLAYGAHRAGLPSAVVTGAVAGPALVSSLDLATSVISVRPAAPPLPPGGRPEALGEPWAPRMLP